MIKNINPIILFVKNFDKSLEFYRDALGLHQRESDSSPNFITFELENMEFSIHGGYSGVPGGPIHFHFVTNDIIGDVKLLKMRCVKFVKEINSVPWGGYEATFLDPDGNEIDIYQP